METKTANEGRSLRPIWLAWLLMWALALGLMSSSWGQEMASWDQETASRGGESLGAAEAGVEVGAPDPWQGAGAGAAEVEEASLVTLETARGGLLLPTETPGRYREAPALATRVHLQVTGPLVRGRVTQRFFNTSDRWQEAVYVFPLPTGGAVDRLRMVVGERVIEGQIQERQQARRTYQQARREGRRASLVEQERPNLFTTSVANIGPQEAIEVVIEYQQVLAYDGGGFQLRFPMVVAPRFIPGGGASGRRVSSAVPDAARITPPVRGEGEGQPNRLQLEIEMDPGFELASLESSYHPIYIQEPSPARYRVTLQGGEALADRDFELRWRPALGEEPQAALFSEVLVSEALVSEAFGDEAYALLMVMPPEAGAARRLPRETVLVIDTSGSMNGSSIVQARQALASALQRLRPEDRFEIIAFNNRAYPLFGGTVAVTPANLERARALLAGLDANGGTQILTALQAALTGPSLESDDGVQRLRQVIFITDGAVGNEEELFGFIESSLGDRRLFTVGIGSAPNAHFMERAARFGRGTFTYIGKPDEVEERMEELFQKIESPQLTDLAVRWPPAAGGVAGTAEVETWPQRLPDLYSGEPVVLAARLDQLAGEVEVTGQRGGQPWSVVLDLGGGADRAGVSQLWARRKIAHLMDQKARRALPEDEVRRQVVEVALRHHLVSKYTSLVAVDVTPVRPATESLDQEAVPTELPRGWSREHLPQNQALPRPPGALPQGATAGRLDLLLAFFLTLVGLWAWPRRRGAGERPR
ncbi:MAG: marine proteobacterial sortase target protein [Acidobacteriota bacterium]|nr:marine proteobacterial sortase target protein [Acidobacteriota bacterium]